jgi:hypothetical protein
MWVLLVGAGRQQTGNKSLFFLQFLVFEILVLPIARVDVSDVVKKSSKDRKRAIFGTSRRVF